MRPIHYFLLLCLFLYMPGTAGAGEPPPEYWYAIQVGAFSKIDLAKKKVTALREKGFESFCRSVDKGDKGILHRVMVGRYATNREAAQTVGQLVQYGLARDCFIKKIKAEASSSSETTRPKGVDEKPAADVSRAEQEVSKQKKIEREELNVKTPESRGLEKTESALAGSVALSLMDAIRYGLSGNRSIQVISFQPQQARAEIENAESAYDSSLFADSSFRRDPNLDASEDTIATEDDGRTRAGIRKPLKTGGTLSAYLETRYGDLHDASYERTYKHIAAPTVELQQPLLNNIGSIKEKTAIKIAKHEATISDAELHRTVIETVSKVSSVYWQVFLFKALIDINRENLDMAEEVLRRETERFSRGLSQQLDVQRARSNAAVRRSTWLRSGEEYELAMDRLKLLLNWKEMHIDSDCRVLLTDSPITSRMDVDEAEVIENALNNRPEIVKARQTLRIREEDKTLARHQRFPRLDAYGRYSISGYGDSFNDAWSDVEMDKDDIWEVGIQFEWKFGNRAARSLYKRKALDFSRAGVELDQITDEIKLEVKQVLHRLETIHGEVLANRSASEAAVNVVEGESARFEIGGTSNEELLRAQDLLAATSRAYVRAVADYNATIRDLACVQGVLPDNIDIITDR